MLCFPSNKHNFPLIAEVVSQHFLNILTLKFCYAPQTPALKMACHFGGLLPPPVFLPLVHTIHQNPPVQWSLVPPVGLEAPSHFLPISLLAQLSSHTTSLLRTFLWPRLPGENKY